MLNMNYFLLNINPTPMILMLMLFFFLNLMNNFFWINFNSIFLFMLMIMFFFYLFNIYFNLMIMENMFMGLFTSKKKMILSNGFMMFILSELMLFISLFWTYIHNAFSPNIYMGNFWPPKGVTPSNPTSMIIFGTAILLSSSFIIMVSHNMFLMKNFKSKSMNNFFFCVFMGLIFVDMQILEMSNFYMKLNFNFNDSIFSSSFLFTTSLHASHVLIGLMGLMMSFKLMKNNINNSMMNSNLEFSIWYWHFVDYIWIAVFSLFYYFNN